MIQGARVELLSPATGLRRESTTNEPAYIFSRAARGQVQITVSKVGFSTVECQTSSWRSANRELSMSFWKSDRFPACPGDRGVDTLNRVPRSWRTDRISTKLRSFQLVAATGPALACWTRRNHYGDGAQRSIRFSGHSLDDSNLSP